MRQTLTRHLAFLGGLLLVVVPMAAGCPSDPSAGDADADPDGGPDAEGGLDGGDGDADGDGDGDVDGGPGGVDILALAGHWVVQVDPGAAAELWGNARADVTSEAQRTVTITVEVDEAATHYLALEEGDEQGELLGYYATSLEDLIGRPLDAANWQGSILDDGRTLAGVWTAASGEREMVFHDALDLDGGATGVWSRRTDGAAAIVATDGHDLLLSVLDGEGSWADEAGRFDAELRPDAPVFSGSSGFDRFDGLAFELDGRRAIHLRVTGSDDSVRGVVFVDTGTAGDLTGRWVSEDSRSDEEVARRGVHVVVEHDDTLYVHEALDYPQGFVRTLQASRSGEGYADPEEGWAGRLNRTGSRLMGEWLGYDGWHASMVRTVPPLPGEFPGTWYSHSVDWAHHEPSGGPVRTTGVVTFEQGDGSIAITDEHEDGNTYRIEAEWVGDHYEGGWYDVAAPDAVYAWRGELMAPGYRLHGTWDSGEYSFAPFPMGDESALGGLGDDTLGLAFDHNERSFVFLRDGASGMAASLQRDLEREKGITIVMPGGEVVVELDERLRITRLRDPEREAAFAIDDAAGIVDVTVRDTATGALSRDRVILDTSDAAITSALDALESEEGLDVSTMRGWLAANPGRFHRIFTGAELPPSVIAALLDGELDPRGFAGTLEKRDAPQFDVFQDVLADLFTLVTIGGVVYWSFSVLMAATAITFCTVAVAIVVVVTAAAFLLYWDDMVRDHLACDPCTLACFWNCDVPPG